MLILYLLGKTDKCLIRSASTLLDFLPTGKGTGNGRDIEGVMGEGGLSAIKAAESDENCPNQIT